MREEKRALRSRQKALRVEHHALLKEQGTREAKLQARAPASYRPRAASTEPGLPPPASHPLPPTPASHPCLPPLPPTPGLRAPPARR